MPASNHGRDSFAHRRAWIDRSSPEETGEQAPPIVGGWMLSVDGSPDARKRSGRAVLVNYIGRGPQVWRLL